MKGLLCLQGGHEFTSDCEEMDRDVLDMIGDGHVAVLAGAARVGDDYDGASGRARRHYESLGATVTILPDPRVDEAAALRAASCDEIGLVVLPGGSPSNLREVLSGSIGERIVEMYRSGCAISGASAGAMVLCEKMVRPDARSGADVVDGLGLVAGMALPHWTRSGPRNWPIPDDIEVWGLPECGGVVIDGEGEPFAVGFGDPSRRVDGEWITLDRR